MSQTRIKVFGPPGTGKTTYCIDLLMDHLQAHDRVLFVSFTRAAKDEAHRRMMAIYGEIPDRAKVSTVHALCLHALSIPGDCLFERGSVKWKFYQTVTHDGVSNTKIKRTLALYQRMRNEDTYSTAGLDVIRQDEDDDDVINPGMAGLMVDRYEEWKRENGYIDFTSLLERVSHGEGVIKDYDVVIIDEAQDLTVLQWRVMERVYKSAGTVYVVGDDDQSVYSFLGAAVGMFLDWPCSAVRVLSQTYRLPQEILGFSLKLAARIHGRQEKEIHTKVTTTGVIRQAVLGFHLAFNVHPSELYLVRNEYMLNRVQDILSLDGVPYRGKKSPWMRYDVQAIQTIIGWKDRDLSAYDWRQIKRFLPKEVRDIVERRQPGVADRSSDEVVSNMGAIFKSETFDGPFWWEKFVPTIPAEIIPTIKKGIYMYGIAKCMNPTLELSTIHGAKGKEADRVYVCTALTDKIKDSLDTTDDEHRLFYVAVTRAKKELFIITDPSANEDTEYAFPNI